MAEQETQNIHRAILAVMAEVGHIGKDRKNPQQGYNFRGIDEVYNALHGPMAKHGVFVAPTVESREVTERKTKNGGALFYTILTVRFRFYAGDGSHVECVTVGEAMDSGDKSSNKAMSAALKYALMQVFCIPTQEDKDTETQTHEVAPRPPFDPAKRDQGGLSPHEKAVQELAKLCHDHNVPSNVQMAWLERASAQAMHELTDEQIAKCKKLIADKYANPQPEAA